MFLYQFRLITQTFRQFFFYNLLPKEIIVLGLIAIHKNSFKVLLISLSSSILLKCVISAVLTALKATVYLKFILQVKAITILSKFGELVFCQVRFLNTLLIICLLPTSVEEEEMWLL